MSEVETARLLLRRWHDDDLERLVALFSDPRVSRFLSHHGRPWPRERTVGVFEHFVCQWEEHGAGPWAVIDKATGRWLGQIGLNELPSWPGPQKVEVGWELDPTVWGRGAGHRGRPGCGAVWLRDGRPGADHQRDPGRPCGVAAGDGEVWAWPFRSRSSTRAVVWSGTPIDRADWQARAVDLSRR